jgi:hypothetical protein
MEFVEAPPFTRRLLEYLTEDAYRELQVRLSENPEVGDLMPGTGGFRKMRWADARQRPEGRIADHLLPLLFRPPNLVDDALQQGRGFRPDTATEKGAESCDRRGISGTVGKATHSATKMMEEEQWERETFLVN